MPTVIPRNRRILAAFALFGWRFYFVAARIEKRKARVKGAA